MHRLSIRLNALANPFWERSHLLAYWWYQDGPNWGDSINPHLLGALSGRRVVHVDAVRPRGRRVLVGVGSILGHPFPKNSHVWGSGFMYANDTLRAQPAAIRAVRGPLTRARVLELGVDCPEVFGDPALLYPRIYRPEKSKQYTLGLIPHHVDLGDPRILRIAEMDGVLLIDVRQDVRAFVDQLCRCEVVASSSLHGLIAADAYGIPSTWIRVSDKILGGEFKFQDHFQAVGHHSRKPLDVHPKTTLDEILDARRAASLTLDLDLLRAVAPF